MTLHAVLDIEAGLAVQFKVVMAGIASVAVDDQACENGGPASRQEIERRIVCRNILWQEPT